jgi:hypothetical protein
MTDIVTVPQTEVTQNRYRLEDVGATLVDLGLKAIRQQEADRARLRTDSVLRHLRDLIEANGKLGYISRDKVIATINSLISNPEPADSKALVLTNAVRR